MLYIAIIVLMLTLSSVGEEKKKNSVYDYVPKWNTYTPEGWRPANQYREYFK